MDKLELTLDPINNSLGYDVLLDLLREELDEDKVISFLFHDSKITYPKVHITIEK